MHWLFQACARSGKGREKSWRRQEGNSRTEGGWMEDKTMVGERESRRQGWDWQLCQIQTLPARQLGAAFGISLEVE